MRTDAEPVVGTWVQIVERIGREVARAHAAEVDQQGRFPRETLAALKAARVLSSAVPRELGGGGADVVEIAETCTALAAHCSSSAMVLAMHQIQVLTLVDHAGKSQELLDYLRSLCHEQRLIASVTSEVGPSGDLRKSVAPVEHSPDGTFRLEKRSTTLSYGQQADDLLITARRNAEAAPSDQVLVLALRGEFELSEIGTWDALGMRGTCSPSAKVRAHGRKWQVLAEPFGRIASATMVPSSHVFWASCWLGLAQDAVAAAHALLRSRAKSDPSVTPRGATRVAALVAKLQMLRDQVHSMAQQYQELRRARDYDTLESVGFALRVNNLKLSGSQLVVELVGDALSAAGIAAYKNDSRYALGRHLRDAYSALVMINNDRLLETNASLLTIYKGI